MTDVSNFDELMSRLDAGERFAADEIAALAATPDILPLGMLADAQRRRLHGGRVTYLRVAQCAYDQSFAEAVPPTARELRITGVPDSLAIAVTAVAQAKGMAGDRVVSAFSWSALVALARGGTAIDGVLAELRGAGLDAVAEVPIDGGGALDESLDQLVAAGFSQVRLTVDKPAAADRVAQMLRAGELQDRYGCIRSINPLPMLLDTFRPTTGYADVKMVAVARLAAPGIRSVQVDWLRYGPKLAQVALTFGADDLDGVTPSDEAPDGRRRAPLEEVRRNIEAAGLTPVERDGWFELVTT